MSRARPLYRPRVAPGLVALMVAATFAAAVPAQTPQQQKFAEGTEVLRLLLKKANFTPLGKGELHLVDRDPEHTVLIVLGDLRWLEATFPEKGLRSWVARGGAILIASDMPTGAVRLQELAGVRVNDLHVECRKNLKKCYRDQPDLPIVKATDATLPDHTMNPFAGLSVVTNIPSALVKATDEPLPDETRILAHFPDRSETVGGLTTKSSPDFALTFAVGGELDGGGRFLVLADHSVFINEMMLADTGNLDFAARCLAWLGGGGQRTHAMFVEDGEINPKFDVPLRKLPPIPPMKILEQMFLHRDELVEESQERFVRAEREGRVDAGILQALAGKDYEGLPRLKRYAWWAIGGGLAAFFLYRLRKQGRFLPETGLPRLGVAVAGQRPAGPLFEQRQREQVASGNLWEAARGLARQRLAPLADATGPPAGSLVAGGGWSRRRAARQRLRRLWEIAYGPVPVAIPPERWEFFLSELEAFERDVADGTVKMPAA